MKLADVPVLWSLLRGLPRSGSHAERIERFYAAQAGHYDRFRERLLHGREALIDMLNPALGEHVVELGCGTGRNLEYLGARLDTLRRIDIVDICPSLLARARERWRGRGTINVVEADACHWRPDGLADAVYLSYSLTMIPQWQAALANAKAMLRPGGRLGVVDFTVRHPHSLPARFWRTWFAHDGVHLDARHATTLRQLFPDHALRFAEARLPYLPMLRVPYYTFVGTKR